MVKPPCQQYNKQVVCNWEGMNVPSWVCTTPSYHVGKTQLETENLMNPILYAIGFTLAMCASLFVGYSPDTPYYQQALMLFAGFCMGGVALCVIENLDE